MRKILDISAYQGHVDWNKVKSAGYDTVILRLGIGDDYTSQDDIRLNEYIEGCNANGIQYGFYLVCYAQRENGNESVESEIAHTERLIQGRNPFAIFYDVEVESIRYLGKATLTNFCNIYCKHFKDKGYNVGVYANKNWFTNYIDYQELRNKGYLIWLAHYGIDTPSLECDIWQYSDKGNIDGINTNTTDMNILYNETILNGTMPTPTPTPSSKDVNVYYRVKTQKHGWLSEVKNLEDYAGWQDSPITALAIKVDKGSIKYRVTTVSGKTFSFVTGYDINDLRNGYAGNGKDAIATVEVEYFTPNDIRPYKYAYYKINNYSYQKDMIKGNGMDGYAGVKGKAMTKFQIYIGE